MGDPTLNSSPSSWNRNSYYPPFTDELTEELKDNIKNSLKLEMWNPKSLRNNINQSNYKTTDNFLTFLASVFSSVNGG